MSMNAESIKEVMYHDIFDPPKTYLNLNDKGIPQESINQVLVKKAVLDAKKQGLKILFLKALRLSSKNEIFLIFEIEGHDDLYWVYTMDSTQKRLIIKFSFSSI